LYNLNRRQIEAELLPYCQTNQITIIAYTPLDSGQLTKGSAASSHPERMKVLESVAKYTQKTLAQVALNWCTSRPGVIAIPKSDKTARVVENCGASGWRISSEQKELLDRTFSVAG
jgi:diketogulonate reductase-like aldo/keto reductase